MKKNTDKINSLCKKCERTCKQLSSVMLIDCPNFIRKAEQMVIKFDVSGKRGRKKKQ